MIKEKKRKTQDCQKSYVDRRRRPLEFQEGDYVFLKVTPSLRLKGSFKTCKLSLRYVGPYQIVSQVGEVAYQLALPPYLYELHDVFHVSQLRKHASILFILFFWILSKWNQISHFNKSPTTSPST